MIILDQIEAGLARAIQSDRPIAWLAECVLAKSALSVLSRQRDLLEVPISFLARELFDDTHEVDAEDLRRIVGAMGSRHIEGEVSGD